MRQELRDRDNHPLGYIQDTGGGRQEVRDAAGTLKGFYNAATNTARDDAGRAVGTGNLLATLIHG